MEKYFLFVHFRETRTPEGEQVYFGISKGGFDWVSLNGGKPMLESKVGERGVRDFTITRTKDNEFVILATDLSLANRANERYGGWAHLDWKDISKTGSHCLVKWTSKDLLNWSEAKLVRVTNDSFGCTWAPDVIYDEKTQNYMVHWSSSHRDEEFKKKKIFYAFTKDFESFTEPMVLYEPDKGEAIDSCIIKENGKYYCFVKIDVGIRLLVSDKIDSEYKMLEGFENSSPEFTKGGYEAPTSFMLEKGKWCLMLDFYDTKNKDEQGYIPFLCDDLSEGCFYRANERFNFPYGFKHGTVLEITSEEYERLKVLAV